ncbi:MAG: efflux RND transporter periplasmic adaptor subunit [Flavobacteriaceae bacterium]
MVQKGDLLLELYNPNTELGYLTQETAIIEQINNLRNTRISIKNQQMTLDRDLIKMTYDYNNAARQYRMDTTLYGKGVISKNDYLKSQETYDFQTKQQLNTKKYVEKEQYDRKIQLNLINTSIVKMEESLEQLRANKENFIVRAPESGLLSSYNPILGKSYEKGELIGKLDMLDGYKVLVRADEYYFNLLEKDQEGLVELEEGTYTLTVKNIVAEVVGGKFDVELVFNEGAPKTIKQGMTLPIKVYLSNKKAKALLLPKGAFYQSSGGQFVFVLKDGNTAEKRKVSIGRANAYYYEILSGISEGDRIITSSYEGFKEKDIINLK